MKSIYISRIGLFLAFLILSNIGISQTYTFTSATATGNIGPTQTLTDAEYLGTTLDGAVTTTAGIQYWVVPTTGVYIIETFGGQGYGPFGGRGAHITGEFNLTAGTTLKILVGQEAGHYFDWPNTGYNHQFGGGGGSFVTDMSNVPFIIAGGGGGNHGTSYSTQCDAQITEAGAGGSNGSILGAGGTSGNGGMDASSADGGGGLLTNGAGIAGGFAFVNGGQGGIDEGTGGFGCGGGTSSWNNYRGGGGGGYSGGGAANNSGTCCPTGGGGGSFNGGTNPVNIAGVQLGNGMIIITNQCNPTVGTLVADVASLSPINADCSSTPTTPTATNDCVSGISGTPDVTFPITTVGTTVVTWSYDDGTNIITQTQSVIINTDVTAPAVDLASLADITAACSVTPIAPTATDICEGQVSGTPDVTFPITTVGTTIVTWTYDDGNGNTITQPQNVIISVDVIAPVINNATLPDLSSQCSITPPIPTATDICAGQVSGTPSVTLPITTQGLTVVTWTYDDGSGNITTQTQNITLNDVAPPALDIPTLMDYTGCNSATPPTATATDFCVGALNGTPDVTFPITAAGPTTVTWTFDDGNGNVVTQTQDVYVTSLDIGATSTGYTITADQSGVVYQWIDCSTNQAILNETNQTYTPTVTGNYAVVVTNNSCSDTSACFLVDYSGIVELDNNPINIYPNPTNDGMFKVDYEGVIEQIIVNDALGRVIQLPVDLSTGKVDGSILSNGKYLVRVVTINNVYMKEIIVIR